MIKRLQRKFILITMTLVTVMLLAILGFVCGSTQAKMAERSMAALRGVSAGPMRPDDKLHGNVQFDPRSNCFVLKREPGGFLEIAGGYANSLDSNTAEAILDAARQSGKDSGVLWEYSLQFQRLDKLDGYAFVDISADIQTMRALVISCLLVGVAAFVVFFVIVWLLSKWVVRPVEEAWDRQRQFVADASHELKTPLAVILTNAELLQSPEYDATTKDRFAASIFTMSNQMRGLVESLLQLARIDNGNARQHMVQLNFSELVESCVLPFEPVYFEAGRSLDSRIQPGLTVQGNEQQLRQVVDILLDNGRKYAQPSTTVTLQLISQGRGHCLLSMASQGEPLSVQQCKDIFKRFYRVDEARSRDGSYGLGLSIAQSIVAQHRGRIWCQSKDGVNTFFVSLPTSCPKK